MNISIVIPNYNGENLLKNNLQKVIDVLSKYSLGDKEIVIVDDGSSDNSLAVVKEIKSTNKSTVNIEIVQNDKNLGFSSTVNKGVAMVKGEVVILLNTDVIPEENFLEPLLKHFSNESVFGVGCMDKSQEAGKTVLRGRGLGYWSRGFLMHRRGEVDKNDTLWVSGGSAAFRKSVWDKLGGLNELYNPFYWEDIDLSYRALKSGYRLIFEAKSVVIHEHEKGAIKSKYSSDKIKELSYKNQIIFSLSNATDIKLRLSLFFWLPYHLVRALFSQNTNFIKGFFSALMLLPQIMVKSFTYRKLFVKSDKDVIGSLSA